MFKMSDEQYEKYVKQQKMETQTLKESLKDKPDNSSKNKEKDE